MLEETEVTCPCCWETISLLVDLSAGSADYTEDCPVCCRPMSVHLRVGEDGDFDLHVSPESD